MLLPSGKFVRVGFAPHELLYIAAANTLCGKEREEAFQEIAEMLGRRYSTILSRASDLRKAERVEARAVLRRFLGVPHDTRRVMVRTPTMAAHRRLAGKRKEA